ncbi:MAG: hypothetical protein H7249_02555 [Chitinophagaceae bacterium]|nr:hypothetical protein [Oligoflexus sp.]
MAFFFSLRDWTYLSFVSFAFAVLLAIACFSGHMSRFFSFLPTGLQTWNYAIQPILLIASSYFSICFLRLKRRDTIFYRIIRSLILISITHVIIGFFWPYGSSWIHLFVSNFA